MVDVSKVEVGIEEEVQLPTDEELVVAAIAGEEAAFAQLFTRYKRLVARVAGRFFPRQEHIEEMLQTTFCRAYLSLSQFRGKQKKSFPAWLSSITANLCLDELRRLQRRQESFFSEISQADTDKINYETAVPSTEGQLISRDLAHKLLAHLRPEDRLALTLLYEEGWSIAEVGNLLGWSVPKVKGRAYQARQLLLRVMEQFR